MKNLKRFFHDRRFYIGVAVVGLAAAVAFADFETFDYTGGHVSKIFARINSNLAQVSNPANITALPMPINKLAGYVYLMNPSGLFPTSGKYLGASHIGDLTQYFLGYWMYTKGYSDPSTVRSFTNGLTTFLEQNLVQDDGSFNASNMKAALYGALSASVDVGDSIEPDQSQMNGYKRMNEPAYIFHLAQQYNRQSVLHGLVYSITRQEAVIAGLKHEILTRQCKDILKRSVSDQVNHIDYNEADPELYYENITIRQEVIMNSLNTLLREYRKMSCLQLYTELTNAQLAVINDEIQLLSLSNQYEQLNMADKAAIGK